jgi:small subunit ribosomal protein S14
MRYKIILDKNKRLLFKQNEIKRLTIKIHNRLSYKLKINTFVKLSNISTKSAFTKIKNRCFISARSKAVFTKLKISRIKFREIIVNGGLPGFTKNSW